VFGKIREHLEVYSTPSVLAPASCATPVTICSSLSTKRSESERTSSLNDGQECQIEVNSDGDEDDDSDGAPTTKRVKR